MDAILTVNVGSSSVKCAVYAVTDMACAYASLVLDRRDNVVECSLKDSNKLEVYCGKAECMSIEQMIGVVADIMQRYVNDVRVVAVGHRVVHGGEAYSEPVCIDESVLHTLKSLASLAPLHLPPEIIGIECLMAVYVDAKHVACFDTSFHSAQEEVVRMYGLPRKWYDAGVKRYGFHGLSYAYIAQAMVQLIPLEHAQGRVIVLHLGSGASACAMFGGKSVASSMGFTALDGLVMGTRCGSLDVGAVLYMMRRDGLSVDEVERMLYSASGLKGLSGISADMRILLASSEAHAKQAVEVFVYRVVREIGSLVAALGGVDALVFTAGIGEHSAQIREKIIAQLGWLGVQLDASQNNEHALCCSLKTSHIGVYVIPTDEEQMIARHTLGIYSSFC